MPTELPLIPGVIPEGEDCFTDMQSLVNLLARYLKVDTQAALSAVFSFGSTAPGPDGQATWWFRTDGDGRPLGIYKFYGGAWRKTYSTIGKIALYSGDPTNVFDADGRGIVGTDLDGWQLMNGNNGTTDLSDKFIIAAKQWDTNAWKTNVTGALTATGGDATRTLTIANLPPHTHGYREYLPDGPGGSGGDELDADSFRITQTTSVGSGTAFSILPPYYALAYMKFIGYT